MAGGVLDDASVVGEGDDVAAGDDVVSGDQGCAVAVRDELSLLGSNGADLFDVIDFHVAVAYSCSRWRRVDVSLPWRAEDEPGWDCGHHCTVVEDRGGIVRACCDILWMSLSADVVVGRLLVILVGIRGGPVALGTASSWRRARSLRLKAAVASPRLL